METGIPPEGLTTPDVFCDFTKPQWRRAGLSSHSESPADGFESGQDLARAVLLDPGQGVRAAATWAVSSELRT